MNTLILIILIIAICLTIILFLCRANRDLKQKKQKLKYNELDRLDNQIKNKEKDLEELNKLIQLKEKEQNKFLEQKRKEINIQIENKNIELNGLIKLTKAKQDNYNNLLASQEQCLKRDLELYKKDEEYKINKELKSKREQIQKEIDAFNQNEEARRATYLEEIEKVKAELEDFYARQQAINDSIAAKRELEDKAEFYSLQLNDQDIEDIKSISAFKDRFHNKELLSKIVYECYIKKPYSELIKRVCHGQKISGIYKITYEPTGEMYIGKSVDIAERWKQHIKTSMGIGTLASSSIHTHMEKHGLWNYSFFILEEVDKDKLNDTEKYYIDFYQTDRYGFNMKAGG